MLGAIIGDIVGSRFEFHNLKSKDFDLFAKQCFATDDSIMTISVAKAILECHGNWDLLGENTVKYMQTIGRKYPDCGYGGMFGKWMFDDDPKPYYSYGNGAAMRVSPCGFIAGTEDEAKLLSKKVTEVTHNHPEGIKGAEAVTIAIFMARKGATRNEIKERIEKDYYRLDFTLDGIRENYGFNGTCRETVPQAIRAFIESVSFEDAIRNAVSIGGDSDTLAAITGSIAEAYYGIPVDIRHKALQFLNKELKTYHDEWEKYFRTEYPQHIFHSVTKYTNKLINQVYINEFHFDFFNFIFLHPEFDLNKYSEILEKNNLKWETESMRSADENILDEQCILALLTGVFRADYFAKGVLDEFIKDGFIGNWLNRLKKYDDDRKVDQDKPALTHVKISISQPESIKKSELNISDRQVIIKFNGYDGGNITHQYDFGEETRYGELSLIKMKDCLETDGWIDIHNINQENFNGYLYQLEAEYCNGQTVMHYGIFDRVHIPEETFKNFINIIRFMTDIYGFGEIIDLNAFMNSLRPGEVMYCGVEFADSGKVYHYRTTNANINIGDTVIVPVGEDDCEKEVIVKTIKFCRWDNTPYPLEKTKEIIRKADDENDELKILRHSINPSARYLSSDNKIQYNDD